MALATVTALLSLVGGCGDSGAEHQAQVRDEVVEDPLPAGFVEDEVGGLGFAHPEEWAEHAVEAPPPGWEFRYEVVEDGVPRYVFGAYTGLPGDITVVQASERFLRGFRSERAGFDTMVRDHDFEIPGAASATRVDYTFALVVAGEERTARGMDVIVQAGDGGLMALRLNGLQEDLPDELVEDIVASLEMG